MPNYKYTVITKSGKEKKGSIEAKNKDQAATLLKAEGNIPTKIVDENLLNKDINLSFGGAKIKPRDLSVFCRQFVSIISAGVSIVKALEMLGEQTENKTMRQAIRDVQSSVEKGETLAGSMRLQNKVFPSLLINMVEAGESSGSLEIAFDRMAVHFEKDSKLKAMVKKAMIYPSAVGIIAVLVIFAMMLFVIPRFITMFDDMDVEMPLPTKIVIGMSSFFVSYWYLIILGVFLIVILYRVFQKTNTGSHLIASMKVKMPIFGVLTVKTAASRFTRTLSTLLAAGVPMIDAIDITSKTMDNLLFKEALQKAKEQVRIGVPLSTPLRSSGLFPPMIVHMVGIGEETGNMESMLNTAADYYDEEVEITTQQVTAALEPLIIVVLAVVVGGLILSIMAPMLTMYDAVGNM